MKLKPFLCSFCGSDRFVRFFLTLDGENVKELTQEQIEERLSQQHPTMTQLKCASCQAPNVMAENDNPQEITFYVEDKDG